MKLPVVGCGDVGEVGGVGKILDASPRINNEISKSIEPFLWYLMCLIGVIDNILPGAFLSLRLVSSYTSLLMK